MGSENPFALRINMVTTDGWLGGFTQTNQNGYLLKYNDNWSYGWEYWVDYTQTGAEEYVKGYVEYSKNSLNHAENEVLYGDLMRIDTDTNGNWTWLNSGSYADSEKRTAISLFTMAGSLFAVAD